MKKIAVFGCKTTTEFIIINSSSEYQVDEIRFSDTNLAEVAPVGIPAADIYAFGPSATIGSATANAAAISWNVPFGTNVSNLAPTYILSAGATCSKASGSIQDFTNPVHYIVQASDFGTSGKSTDYTVTVTVAPYLNNLIWNLAGGGTWDTSTANWKDESSSQITAYNINKNAFFNNAAGGDIILSSSVLPLSTTVNAASGNYTFNGVLAGTGKLTKSGSGSLSLNGVNIYTGGTLINSGVVYCSELNSSPFGLKGSVNVTIQSGARLVMNRNQITGNFTLNGGQVDAQSGWGDDAWIGSVVLGATSTVDLGSSDGALLVTGVVSGPGGWNKIGTSVRPLRLAGENTFTGAVNVQAGVIEVASLNRIIDGTASSNLGAPTTVTDGTISLGAYSVAGTLSYSGPGETTDRVIKLAGTKGGGVISQAGTGSFSTSTRGQNGLLKLTSDVSIPGSAGQDNRKTLTLSNQGSSYDTSAGRGEISGSIGDSVLGITDMRSTSIVKAGLGSWTLSGVNGYTGGTKIESGTLIIARSLALGSGPLDVSTGAKVQLDYIGSRQVSALSFNSGIAQPNGTYGSTASLATYKDDAHFSGVGSVTVGTLVNATTTKLLRTTGSEPSNISSSLTFTATVEGASPAGNVVFYDGLTAIGTSALNSSFAATITTNNLSSGVHIISALYLGTASSASSSVSLTQTVVETRTLITTTNLARTGGASPSAYGAAVTFTATVAGSTPTGTVMFYNGTSPIGISTLNGTGLATLTLSSLPAGWLPINARYLGDATHLPSAAATALFQTINPPAGNGKLKIFILAGQSNMLGKGKVEIGRDPENYGNTNFLGGLGSLRNMLNREPNKYGYLADPVHPIAGGRPGWLTLTDVTISTFAAEDSSNAMTANQGDLAPNFGNLTGQGLIGPEYGFGLVAGSQLADKVLIIKYSVGGLSLAVNYRPPSSGGTVGPYYSGLIARVNNVIANLSPADKAGGYEVVGFGWHQGYNDRINPAYAAEYESNMVNLIKDIRTAVGVPKLPVSIGNTGMDVNPSDAGSLKVIAAQAAVANPVLHPELFAGTVTTVDTRPFNYGEPLGASSEGYHWYSSGESYFNIGDSMGKAMMAMIQPASSAKDILTFQVPGQTAISAPSTNISIILPAGTDVTHLAPNYTVSIGATGSPVSGSIQNFTTPQTYTITAQDQTTQVYNVAVVFASSTYSDWANNPTQGLAASERGALVDPDGDGISNLLEFALGGAPNMSSQTILPKLTKTAGNWMFEYERSVLARSPATIQEVEYGNDLTGWTAVVIPPTSAGSVAITQGAATDHVAMTIPAGGNKLFVRLKVRQ